MDSTSLKKIMERAQDSRTQSDRVNALRRYGPALSLRKDFARCAIDLACEHHSAIIRLVCSGEYGSAAAMQRPLLEAGGAASWLLYSATCKEIQHLATDREAAEGRGPDLPLIGRMLKDLQPTFPKIKVLADGLQNRGPATWLHKYTHGGTAQLVRRPSGWIMEEVLLLLIRADTFAVVAAAHETVIEANADLSMYAFGRRDDLGVELQREFGTEPVEQQPHTLPPALADGCGPPFSG